LIDANDYKSRFDSSHKFSPTRRPLYRKIQTETRILSF